MDSLGTDFNNTGSVMSRSELEEVRRKRGECVTCGRKCFKKKLFKMVPITEHGLVLEGRCLNCRPLDAKDGGALQAVSRPATREDLERFTRSQSNLSSRNLMATNSSSSGGRRPMPARAASHMPRSDNRSVGSNSTGSRPQIGLRSASVMPSTLAEAPVQTPRVAATLPSSSGGESQPLSVPPQPSRSAAHNLPNGSHHTVEGLPQSQTSPSMASATSRDRFPPTNERRRASHSDVPLGLPTADRNMPTPEELQRAAMTLLAAKQHGLYEEVFEEEEMRDLDDHLDQLSADKGLGESYEEYDTRLAGTNSVHSGSSLEDGHPDEIDAFEVPRHGILDRGGSFPLSPLNGIGRPGTSHVVSGSSRTLSSMSSLEEDIVNTTGTNRRGFPQDIPTRGPVEALYEESDNSHRSARSSHHDRSMRGASQARSGLSDQEYVDKIHTAGDNFGDILLCMRDGITSPLVVGEGLDKLGCLQLGPEDYDLLADMGAPHVIAAAMEEQEASIEVQLLACSAIWNMSASDRLQLMFVDAGVLERILYAMDRYIDDVELQEKAMAALSNLGALADNLDILDETGAVSRIVEAMNKHSEVVSVQVKGCAAVSNLASHESPLKERIVECGAGGAVVVSMVMHPSDVFLQEKALQALRNLSANSEANKVELANIGGIDAAISAMQVHRDEAGVQEEAAWAISNLAGNDDNKAVIGDCGGIDVVIRAMWVHSDVVGVQEWCCRALFTLTLDQHNGNVVVDVGGIPAVVNAMQAHADSPTVQEMGCAVLGNLAGSDECRMKIVDEEALDAIVLAMVIHTDDMQVQERACLVLMRLAIEENIRSMQAANIPELVRVAAEKFPSGCQEPAGRLLSTFSGQH